jgi:hypothetical protein
MDIEESGTRVVYYYTANSFPLAVNHLVEGLGNNAVQVERIDKANVSSITLLLSGLVPSLTYPFATRAHR